MATAAAKVFMSYARTDANFAHRLAEDLKAAGVSLWLDQLDIPPGERWDRAVEAALEGSTCLLVIISRSSMASENVMDEISYAIDEKKDIVPLLAENCKIPFRVRRLQSIDFTNEYGSALKQLLIRLTPPSYRNKDAAKATTQLTTREEMGDAVQIFLSYAAEDRQSALAIQLALVGLGTPFSLTGRACPLVAIITQEFRRLLPELTYWASSSVRTLWLRAVSP